MIKHVDFNPRHICRLWFVSQFPYRVGFNVMVTRVLTSFSAVLSFLLLVTCVMGSEPSPTVRIEQVDVGFDGYYKVGKWAPLTATISATQPVTVRLVVDVLDPDGRVTSMPSEKFELSPDGTNRHSTVFRSGRLDSQLEIRVVETGRTDADRVKVLHTQHLRHSANDLPSLRAPLKQSATIWVTLGNPAGFNSSSANSVQHDSKSKDVASATDPKIVVHFQNVEQLPNQLKGYDGLDALIVSGQYELDEQRNAALREWVQMGGHLVVSVGSNASAYRNSQLARWIPIPVVGDLQRRELSALEIFADSTQRILSPGRVNGARLSAMEGKVLVDTLDGPLLVRVPVGFGRVTLLGMDLDRPPLKGWPAVTVLSRRLVADRRESTQFREQNVRGRLSHSGITELASQLHAIQEHFPDIPRFSFWMIMGLTTFYLLIIGPIDYWIVHRVLKKPQFTWITFPAMVIVCGLLAMWLARWTNGDGLRVNQLDLVDIDGRSQIVRGHTWLTVYSPAHQRYRISVQSLDSQWRRTRQADQGEKKTALTDESVRPVVTWNGIPENAYRGMYRSGGFEIGRTEYRFAHQATAIENIPIPIWSTKSLTACWNHQGEALVNSSLKSTGVSQLSNTMLHHLPVAIDDWIVAYGNQVFYPHSKQYRKLKPGVPWDPNGPGVDSRTLKGYLTRATKTQVKRRDGLGADILIEQADYDPLSLDPTQLIRILTFHEVVGGPGYTGLTNHAMRKFDFSNMLALDRAVLFGKIDRSAAKLNVTKANGQPVPFTCDRQVAYVRVLLPVQQTQIVPKDSLDFGNEWP